MADARRAFLAISLGVFALGEPGGCRKFDYSGVACNVGATNGCPSGLACVAANDADPGAGYCAPQGTIADSGTDEDAGADGGNAGIDAGTDAGTDAGADASVDASVTAGLIATITSVNPHPVAYDGSVNIQGTAQGENVISVNLREGLIGVALSIPVTDGGWSANLAATNWFQNSFTATAVTSEGNTGDASAPYRVFTVGFPATDVVGLPDASFTLPCNGTPHGAGFKSPGPLAIDPGFNRLFVADRENYQILIFNLNADGTPAGSDAFFAIGQSDVTSCIQATLPDAKSMNNPEGLAVGRDRLFVSDTNFNRVLVFNVDTVVLAAPLEATSVLGQPNMTSSAPGAGASGLSSPYGLAAAADAGLLFVADRGNNRILVFDITTLDAGKAAIAVLGQSDFNGTSPDSGTNRLNQPVGVAYDDTRQWLYVGDSYNNRVLVFDVAAIDAGENAIAVLGQPSFAANGASASTMNGPGGVALTNDVQKRLYVADNGNHRVLVYDSYEVDAGELPIAAIGQPDFATVTGGTSAVSLSFPRDVVTHVTPSRQWLFVGEAANNRVTGFDITNAGSITTGMDASVLLGHVSKGAPVFTSDCANGPNDIGFDDPRGIAIDLDGHRLFVVDRGRNRVLVFGIGDDNATITRNASSVLGQVNFASCGYGTSARTLNRPNDVAYDPKGNRLFIADEQNYRVVVFDDAGMTTGGSAIAVLGQSTLNSVDGPPAASQSRFGPTLHVALDADGGRLFLSDGDNHRVLVFDVAPGFPNGADAGFVLGQTTFTTSAAESGTPGFMGPRGLAFDAVASRMFVADQGNSRVLVFNTTALANNMNAEFVLGRQNFDSIPAAESAGDGGVSLPVAVALSSSRTTLYVSDGNFNRVAVFDLTRLATGLMASTALGQPTFATIGGLSSTQMQSPRGLAVTSNRLFAVDSQNDRVLIFNVGP
ncbi:MAG: NHL repeat-containing protein [Deltaproteobacteria bacterium]|nr:NHL repeat-containing protein [Deltaproteobacteria bacterium]